MNGYGCVNLPWETFWNFLGQSFWNSLGILRNSSDIQTQKNLFIPFKIFMVYLIRLFVKNQLKPCVSHKKTPKGPQAIISFIGKHCYKKPTPLMVPGS